MNNKTYIFLMIIISFLLFPLLFGCGKYVTQYSNPVIISRYPAKGAGGIGSAETIWVKFSKMMNEGNYDIAALGTHILFAGDMTATATFYPDITPEGVWSEDNTKLSINNAFFIAYPGNRVHVISSYEVFEDTNGLFLQDAVDLWDFTLSGLNIVNRVPAIGAIVTNEAMTLEATFNNAVATYELFPGPDHTAVITDPNPPNIYFSVDNKTIFFEITSWEVSSYPATVDITYEAMDVFGNVVFNGQLFKYDLISP